MTPSQAAATPIVARNAGRRVVAISCDQSLNRDASPTPTTVRFSHGRRRFWLSGILGIARQSHNIVPCRDGSGLEARLRRREVDLACPPWLLSGQSRSEEHTSELQSPCNLVCRLLLEKKKRTRPRLHRSNTPRPSAHPR